MSDIRFNLSRLQGRVIAIDGPAGSGKSTTARAVAEKMGYLYLDTGAMYRAVTWFALENGIPAADAARLGALARQVPIEFRAEDSVQHVLINGVDVTEQIRSPEVTRHVSQISAHKEVREAMVAQQRKLAKDGSVVAEGRDTTTVVFPKADIKIYLDAGVRQRAQRRLLDMVRMGVTTTLEEQEADIKRRDEYDSTRTHSPLKKAPDAYVVDTSQLTLEGQIDHIMSLILSVLK